MEDSGSQELSSINMTSYSGACFVAAKIIGGKNAPLPVGELGMVEMTQALELIGVSYEQFICSYRYTANTTLPHGSYERMRFALVQEEKLIKAAGPANWQKAYYVPTKADVNVVAFRKWLKKYVGGQIDWGTRLSGSLSPTPPKEQLLDRYWSCSSACKGFNALKIFLQVFSVALVALMAASKPRMISDVGRKTLAAAAILCFVGSKWLTHFIHKNFHFHDYNHAFK